MKTQSTYKRIASYEAEFGDVKNILLLYSGGLDTSVMIKWLQDEFKANVVTLTLDIGQQKDDLEKIKAKALTLGSKKAIVYDAKKEFAETIIAKGIKANASYQGDYHLSTPMGRAITSKKAVEFATKEKCDAIAHGCTGKGNDQVRFDSYILALAPQMKIIAPVREWNMDRNEEIAYAKKHGIDVPASLDFPYSVDDNMWGMTWEGGEIEEPDEIAPISRFLTTYTLPYKAPEEYIDIDIAFEKGLPVAINGKNDALHKLIMKLNHIGGAHGVGITHMIEDRLVGLKNGGVYEQPGGHIIIEAHKALEKYVSTRQLNELKAMLDIKWGYLCYGAQWFDPVMDAINAFNDQVNQLVTGTVTVRLFKGSTTIVALQSKHGLHHASFNTGEGYNFNVNASTGFIEIYGLQMKLANSRGSQ